MIDYWELTKDFAPGDIVQRILPGQGISPYTGRVLNSLPAIGFLDIQWAFGTERVSPEELLKMNPEQMLSLPPEVTFDYHPGIEVQKRANRLWATLEVPAGFHKELAKLWHRKASEVRAYDELYHRYASYADDEAMRNEVAKFYRFAHKMLHLLFQQEASKKTAAYWASKDRNYRATRGEIDSGRPNCPKCGSQMRRTVYKMKEGQKSRLFACPSCLYLIKQDNILGPGGEPVGG